MGWSVAAGMFTASALTLLVIPVVYTLIDDFTAWLKANPIGSMRLGFYAVLLGLGGWITLLPVSLGLTGPAFWTLGSGGLILAALAGLIIRSASGSNPVLVAVAAALGGTGVALLTEPGFLTASLPGLDLVRSGYVLIGLSITGVVLRYVSDLRQQREVDP
jgi:hypothetical protein